MMRTSFNIDPNVSKNIRDGLTIEKDLVKSLTKEIEIQEEIDKEIIDMMLGVYNTLPKTPKKRTPEERKKILEDVIKNLSDEDLKEFRNNLRGRNLPDYMRDVFFKYPDILIPMVRRVFPELIATDIVGVQPMN